MQTGAGADPLILRPGLAGALKEARSARCPLIVSRLDRLSRNVHFITGLMEHKVHFIVAALGRNCDHFVLHIYASLAEQERKLISERNKAAAAALKRKGRKLGLAARSRAHQRRISALAIKAVTKAATERAEAHRLACAERRRLVLHGARDRHAHRRTILSRGRRRTRSLLQSHSAAISQSVTSSGSMLRS